MRVTRMISALLGAGANAPAERQPPRQVPTEWSITRLSAPRTARSELDPGPYQQARSAQNRFAHAFPTQSARAALLDECVERAQERAKVLEAASRP